MMESFKEVLNSAGIRPSYPRLKIYEYLFSKKNHPTVEMIYRELYKEIPTLSKTTVYNTLHLFSEKGIAKLISIEDGEARYDADTSLHGHFKCSGCGQVYDFYIEEVMTDGSTDGFRVDKREVYYYGTCKNCLSIKN